MSEFLFSHCLTLHVCLSFFSSLLSQFSPRTANPAFPSSKILWKILSTYQWLHNVLIWISLHLWHNCFTVRVRTNFLGWPDSPPQSGGAHKFSLIPVIGVGVTVDGEQTGRNGGRRFNKDMTKDEMTFLDTQRIVRPLSQICVKVRNKKKVRVCEYGEVLSVHPVAFMAVARLPVKKSQDLQMEVSLSDKAKILLLTSVHKSLCASRSRRSWRCHRYCWHHHALSCHPWGYQFWHCCPKMKTPPPSSFLLHVEVKMMRNTLASGNSTTLNVVGLLGSNVSFCLVLRDTWLDRSFSWAVEDGSITLC